LRLSRIVAVNRPMRRALITGVGGQDGTLLAEKLLDEGWEVHGSARSADATVARGVIVHVVDFADPSAVAPLVAVARPDVLFNLAGISSVAASWGEPVKTATVNGTSVVALLEAIRADRTLSTRFVQASSSEIFGDATQSPQNEETAMAPTSPYGAAKAFAQTMVGIYRHRGLFASSAILYNHESVIRPQNFVMRKITKGVAEIALGRRDLLHLGDLDVRRDWGWAPDYVDALIAIAGANRPNDYVVATGRSHTVREIVTAAFAAAGVSDWQRHVELDKGYHRPADAREMLGDPSRISEELGWNPTVTFREMVDRMVRHDLEALAAVSF